MPVVTSKDIMLKDLQKHNARCGRDVLAIREAPEADVAAFQAMVFACNPVNTKCWLVTLYATLVED